MTNEEKKTLREARKEVREIQSLDEVLKTLNIRLFGIPAARIADEARCTVDPCAKEQLMDRKNDIENELLNARLRASAAFMQAEEIIERVKHPGVRAALRYYYLCCKSLREVASLMQRSEKTVKRWFYREL